MTQPSSSVETLTFTTPLETDAPSMDELVRRAWPEGTQEQRRDLFEQARVLLDERPWRDPKRPVPEEMPVAVKLLTEGAQSYGIPEAQELHRGDGWILVDKPDGMPGQLDRDDPMNPVLFLADMLGLDRQHFAPAWPMPMRASGPWLFGLTDEEAQRLSQAWRDGRMMLTFLALTRRLELPRGQLLGPGDVPITYSVTSYDEGLCELQLIPDYGRDAQKEDAPSPVEVILSALAGVDAPVLGDRQRGGYMVDGGLRLRLAAVVWDDAGLGHSYPAPDDWWPEEPVLRWEEEPEEEEPEESERASARRREDVSHTTLRVSEKTMEILTEQGHPWVLEDADTAGRDHLKPGTLVQATTRHGDLGPWVLIEGTGKLAARVWADADEEDAGKHLHDEAQIRVDEAIVRRAELFRNIATTDIFRIIHGEADGIPGLFIDRIGPLLRATVTGWACRRIRRTVYESVLEHDPRATLIEIRHTEDIRQRGELPTARVMHEGGFAASAQRVIGLEDGLRYWCEPWEGIDVGFFADQRANRRVLRAMAEPGQRWLNLFGHTGAFSVALASRGATVVNVDVSQRYLDWTAQNFEVNRLDADLNVGVCADARAHVRESDEVFHGIIVDPPTAAQGKGGEGFWSVRSGYEDLLVSCFERLAPRGVMLVCRNDRRGRGSLTSMIHNAAETAGRHLSEVTPAGPASDYPTLKGFPEGDPFEGWLARCRD